MHELTFYTFRAERYKILEAFIKEDNFVSKIKTFCAVTVGQSDPRGFVSFSKTILAPNLVRN